MLPNFLVIGGFRCGSTFLRKNLHLHPDVYVLPPREAYASGDVHFFDASNEEGRDNYERGLEWYEGLFDDAGGAAVGEKTGSYLADPVAPELIARYLGTNIRLVAMLRDPVDRAYSSFWYHRVRHFANQSFSEALATETGQALLIDPGYYARHLARYLEYFPRSRLYVTLSEEVFGDPEHQLGLMCKFLRVDAERMPAPSHERVNRAVTGGTGYALEFIGQRIKSHLPGVFERLKSAPGAQFTKAVVARARGNQGAAGDSRAARQYPAISPQDRQYLLELYCSDVIELGTLFDLDIAGRWNR